MKRTFSINLTVDADDTYDWSIKDVLDTQDFYMFCLSITKSLLSNTHETTQWGNPMYMEEPMEPDDKMCCKLDELYLKIMSERDCVENEIKPIFEKK